MLNGKLETRFGNCFNF